MITQSELDLAVNSDKKTLVKFGTEWCGPCKMADIVLKNVVESGFPRVIKINVEKNIKLGSKYKIRSMPTFIIFQNGEIVERFTKRHTKQELINKLK